MKYVDKNRHAREFDQYTLAYLKKSKQSDGYFHPRLADSDSYSSFSRRSYKQKHGRQRGWLAILLEEQGYRCCYCMKRLRPDEVSVEHLVPENFTGMNEAEEYAYYCSHAPRIAERIELGSRFDKIRFGSGSSLDRIVKMPHMVAHSNLFASCLRRKGDCEAGCSCNNRRGNRRILPLMLIQDVGRHVFYEPNGEISIVFDDVEGVEATMRSLGLNGNTLRQIRRLWYLASRTNLTVEQIRNLNEAERIDLLLEMFHREELWELPREYQKYAGFGSHAEDAYWRLFLQYDWFLLYYRRHYR